MPTVFSTTVFPETVTLSTVVETNPVSNVRTTIPAGLFRAVLFRTMSSEESCTRTPWLLLSRTVLFPTRLFRDWISVVASQFRKIPS